jgi:group I intron endonuclease
MNQSGIYQIQNLINGKVYIGSAIDLYAREYEHFRTLKINIHHSYKLKNAVNKYGIENFEFSVIEYVDNIDNLIKTEQFYIDAFDAVNNGYNVCEKAGSTLGFRHSGETKEKIRQARYLNDYSNDNNPFYGKKHSEKTKNIISLKNKGHHRNLGTKYTEERKNNIKVNHADFKGSKNPNALLDEMKVILIREMKSLNISVQEISRKFHTSISTINKIIYRQTWKNI